MDANKMTLIGLFVTILLFVLEHFRSRNKRNLEITMKCIDEFNKLDTFNLHKPHDICRYLDLVSEELFYMEQRMILKKVRKEWLESIIHILPILYETDIVENGVFKKQYVAINKLILEKTKSPFQDSSNWSYLFSHPRILKVIHTNYTLSEIEDMLSNKSLLSPLSTNTEKWMEPSESIAEEYPKLNNIIAFKKELSNRMYENIEVVGCIKSWF